MPKREYQRSPEAQTWRHWYWTARWRRNAKHFLQANPLCVFCQREGRVTAASVVDHIIDHKGNTRLFWDPANWQALCPACHNVTKRREDRVQAVGKDGWPI